MLRNHFSLGLAAITILGLIACNNQDTRPSSPSEDPDEDRYHERSFSWGQAPGGLPKAGSPAGIASRQTTFPTTEALTDAVKALEGRLNDQAFTDTLWKPVDYACDELDLALWNAYGTVKLGDSTVFNEDTLKSRCRPSDWIPEGDDSADALGKHAGWKWWNESEIVDRQYPYKMIGRSWDNFNLVGYKSTGGETQFEKRRSRFGITAWYDTDASRIGIRIYLLNCGRVGSQQYCYYGTSWSNWYKDDDYVSKRDFALGELNIRSNGVPTVRPAKLNGSDAVISMHSVDHAGLQFRAFSSSGMDATGIMEDIIFPEYVTW